MNILLVDDEEYVLDYLETEIPWATLGISNIYRAESAKGALEIAACTPLSIIITDIRMPERSGLELLSSLQRHYPDIKVVMLSGYSDFSYAVKALQHGAADYLLKPVTEDEVTSCLKKIIAKIEQETRQRQDLVNASDVLKLGLGRTREHLLLDLLLGKKYNPLELERHLKTLHLQLQPASRCALALIRMEMPSEEQTREDYELLSYAVLNMAEETLFGEIKETLSLWHGKDHHHFIIAVTSVPTDDDYNAIVHKLETLQQHVVAYLKRTISILLTPPFSFQTEVQRSYTEALNAFWRFVGTRSNALFVLQNNYLNALQGEQENKPLTRLHQSPTMQQLMETGRWDEAASKLDHILEELDMPACGTNQHLMEVVYYLFSSFSFIAHKQGDSFTDMVNLPNLQAEAFRFHSTAQIRELALSLMDQFKRSLQEAAPNRKHIIRQIQDYIDQNLQEDVSLTKLGEHVYLHPVYLSRLYKKDTGESLSAYITRIRMEKAAKLLITTNLRVADIAQEVGYRKTQYFINMFKENYHCTPQNYRNQ